MRENKVSVYLISEAGCNHCGDMDLAQRMIEAAALAGVDAVKFQAFKTDLLINAEDIEDLCRKCELGPQDIRRLMGCCRENNVDFLASAFDIPSLELLAELGVKKLKIPSGQIHNKKYLEVAAKLFIHDWIFMSTGMATHWEIYNATYYLANFQRTLGPGFPGVQHVLMHCTTGYPVPLNQACMRMMGHGVYATGPVRRIGFSDHTMVDATCAIMAVALGAEVIEHHFYLDKVDCPDMPASFDMLQLSDYIRNIRDAELALGAGHHKFIQPCEEKHLKRRDGIRYPDKEQGLDKKANHGDSRPDISGDVSSSPEVSGDLRQ